jgi:hypothetical protein
MRAAFVIRAGSCGHEADVKWLVALIGCAACVSSTDTDGARAKVTVTIGGEASGSIEVEVRPATADRAATGTYCARSCSVSARVGDTIVVYAVTPSRATIDGACEAHDDVCAFAIAGDAEVRVQLDALPAEMWTFVTDSPVESVRYDARGLIVARTASEELVLSSLGELIDRATRSAPSHAMDRSSLERLLSRDSRGAFGAITNDLAVGPANEIVVAGRLAELDGDESGFIQLFDPL